MFSCLKYARFYRIVAIALVVAITCTAFPPPEWAWVTVRVARAASLFDPAARSALPGIAQAPEAAASMMDAITAALPMANSEWRIANQRISDRQPGAAANQRFRELPAISVSRLQSAYTPGEAISRTLTLTFRVTNNRPPTTMPEIRENATFTDAVEALTAFDASADPNTVHNVLLVDVLTADAAFASADPRADYKGDEYTWNLGSIPPMKSVTATMVLTVPASVAEIVALDTGATAWGTLAGEMVSASACPATLAPASLGEYLAPTVDADFRDADVARRAGQLCPNPTDAFEYVRALGYEAYKGSLRGARGTEWSQAGNSLDQANLLLATLRGNGVPARYRHGTLSTERAQELILSMFPTTGAVVGQVPDGVEVSDPANDPELLTEVRDHWWVEAYVDGSWVAMDPAFSYAEPGQTFATPSPPCEGGAGGECAEIPDGARHKVTVSVEIEKYDMLSYLSSGFGYTTPLSHTFTTAELVGQPLTLEHLTSHETPPMGYLIYGWTYYTYVPYLRLGDNETLAIGKPFWELLSNYPFGQFAVTAEYLHFDVTDADGHTTRYTRQIADRAKAGPLGGPLRSGPRQILGLMNQDALSSLGPETFPLVHRMDSHTVYFNPSWMSSAYAASVGENLLVTAPRIAEVESIAAGLGFFEEGYEANFGAVELAEVRDLVEGSTQAFDRMLGASFVTTSDRATQDLAATSLVRAYPATPRITIASSVLSMSREISRTTQVQILDLLNDSVRAVAHPGQARGAEKIYRMTRGVCNTFLESAVGEALLGSPPGEAVKSAANVLQAAQSQAIPLAYVDAGRLDVLAGLQISTQARAFIVDIVQKGYGVIVPERMVDWGGGEAIAWWQLDLATGEMVGVGEDGTHDFITFATMFMAGFLVTLYVVWIIRLLWRLIQWRNAILVTWDHFWREAVPQADGQGAERYENAFEASKRYMNDMKEQVWWWGR